MADRAFLAQKEEEEKEAGREFRPTEVQIERMLQFLEERHCGILDSVTHAAQKAIGAAGVAYGYEAAAKMLDAVSKMPEVKYESRPVQKTKAVMDGIKELPAQPQASAEVREVSHFAWSYYNKELGKEVVTEGKAETARSEFDGGGEEEKGVRQRRGEDDERPMALRVGHRAKIAEPELVMAQRQAEVDEAQKKEEKTRAKIAAGAKTKTPKIKAKIIELKEEFGERAASAAAKPETPEENEAKKAVLLAASKERIAPVIEFVLKQDAAEGKRELKLLEVDEKKLEVMERQVGLKIAELKKEAEFLQKTKEGAKMRALRRRLAFWKKAHGALRRLAGGFFGSVAKMVGGIFR